MDIIIKAIESVSAAISELEVKRFDDTITDAETEAYSVLRACYEMLARTYIIESMTDKRGKGLFKHSGPDTLWEFIYRLVSSMGSISFRKLLNALLNERLLGPKKLTQVKIGEAIDVHHNTISCYLRNKQSISSDNLEKIINYILETN